MITIFSSFGNFRRKKLAFFLKIDITIQILQKLVVDGTKGDKILGKNVFKIITFAPDICIL
jgi:hypothetical protein